MSAEIFDLRTRVGHEAYLNHLKRQMEGKSAAQLGLESAALEIQVLAINRAITWMQAHFVDSIPESAPMPSPEEIKAFQRDLVTTILRSALETLSFDDTEAEKYLGPDWHPSV